MYDNHTIIYRRHKAGTSFKVVWLRTRPEIRHGAAGHFRNNCIIRIYFTHPWVIADDFVG